VILWTYVDHLLKIFLSQNTANFDVLLKSAGLENMPAAAELLGLKVLR
jgi:hypothetical protein